MADDNALDKNLRSDQLLSIESQSLERSNISESKIWKDFKSNTADVPTAANRYLFPRCEGLQGPGVVGDVGRRVEPALLVTFGYSHFKSKIKPWQEDLINHRLSFRWAAKAFLDYEIERAETKS